MISWFFMLKAVDFEFETIGVGFYIMFLSAASSIATGVVTKVKDL